jgi:hypothetical protein
MFTAILAFVVLLMAGVLLAPATANNVMHPSVPKDLRPPPSRLVFVPVIVIFLFGTFMFDSLVKTKPAISADPLQQHLASIAGLLFLLFGAFACLWPLRFMRISVPRLRSIDGGSIDATAANTLSRVARGFGILFLLAAAFLLRGWFR